VAGLETVDASRIGLVGYCLGGTGIAHYLNAGGGPVAGAVGVHPSLVADEDGPASGSVDVPALFLTGGADFLTSPASMADLEEEMTAGRRDDGADAAPWETVRYAKINHAFSNWFSEGNYDARVDARSWHSALTFLEEQFDAPAAVPDASTQPLASGIVEYADGDHPLKGCMSALPEGAAESPLPAVIILPHSIGNGPGAAECLYVARFAASGYVGFVADVYSHEVDETSQADLQERYHANTTLYLSRIRAAVDHVKALPQVDAGRLALLGFGFGGSGALYYALLGDGVADEGVRVVASFHGELDRVANATAGLAPGAQMGGGAAWGSGGAGAGGTSWGSGSDGAGASWGGAGGSGASPGGENGSGGASWGGESSSGASWGGESSSGASWGGEGGGAASSESGGGTWDNDQGVPSSANNETRARRRTLNDGADRPQLLIQSGVRGDAMAEVIRLEDTLVALKADYELTRFSNAGDNFAIDSRASARSFAQLDTLLAEMFEESAEAPVADSPDEGGAPTDSVPNADGTEASSNSAPAGDDTPAGIASTASPTAVPMGTTEGPTASAAPAVATLVGALLVMLSTGISLL